MSLTLIGQLAALVASLCFSLGPTLFTLAGRRVGSLAANHFRLLFAVLFLVGIHQAAYGLPYPRAQAVAWASLFLSGVIGLAVSDGFLFEAFVRIGPRLAMLILNLVPVLTTAAAWVLFGERLTGAQLAAMGVALGGVTWVVSARPVNPDGSAGTHDRRGVIFALVAVLLQTISTLLAKKGMLTPLAALSGNLIRMSGGVLALWGWTLLRGRAGRVWRAAMAQPRALGWIAAGVLIGPVAGMSLSLFALKVVPVGIVSTLGALPPVFLIPISRWVFHEQVTSRAVWGTLVATAGVVWLLLLGAA